MEEFEVVFFANDGDFVGAFVDWCNDEVLLHSADCDAVVVCEAEYSVWMGVGFR